MEAKKQKKNVMLPTNVQPWIVTFADMMSLLLCFFIMLLSMSEPKKRKFEDTSGSMRTAFGVHKTFVEEKAPLNEKIVNAQFAVKAAKVIPADGGATLAMVDAEAEELQKALGGIANVVEITSQDRDIILRLSSDLFFSTNESSLKKEGLPTLTAIAKELKKLNKQIVISSHIDDSNVDTKKYRSKWDLTSARASTVALALMKLGSLEANRFTIVGHADTRPILDNSNNINRLKNRRIEIILKTEKP